MYLMLLEVVLLGFIVLIVAPVLFVSHHTSIFGQSPPAKTDLL